MSYVELYMEDLVDLLRPGGAEREPVVIREDDHGRTLLANLTAPRVASADEALRLMAAGGAARRVASTKMNERSSRSHSIFTIAVEKQTAGPTSQCALCCATYVLPIA